MKKSNLFWIMGVVMMLMVNFTLSACSDEDDNAEPVSNGLTGEIWVYESETVYVNDKIDPEDSYFTKDSYFIFNPHGKGSDEHGDITWKAEGNKLTINGYTYTYEIANEKLILTGVETFLMGTVKDVVVFKKS